MHNNDVSSIVSYRYSDQNIAFDVTAFFNLSLLKYRTSRMGFQLRDLRVQRIAKTTA